MPSRKIMSLGSSLAITLPVHWLKAQGLKKGDVLLAKTQKDNTLLLSKVEITKKESKELHLLIMAEDKPEKIVRGIIAGFLNGYTTIRLTSNRVFTVDQQRTVRSITSRFYMIIMKSDVNSITLNTLLDDYSTSIISSVERMNIITVSIWNDLLRSMRNPDLDLLKATSSLEEDIDQLKFLILRLIRLAAVDPQVMSQQALDPLDCLDYETLANRIERIADHLTNIAQSQISLTEQGKKIPYKILETMLEGAETTFKAYDTAVQGFISRDVSLMDDVIEKERFVMELYQRLTFSPGFLDKDELTILPDIISIMESIRKISHYSADIA